MEGLVSGESRGPSRPAHPLHFSLALSEHPSSPQIQQTNPKWQPPLPLSTRSPFLAPLPLYRCLASYIFPPMWKDGTIEHLSLPSSSLGPGSCAFGGLAYLSLHLQTLPLPGSFPSPRNMPSSSCPEPPAF